MALNSNKILLVILFAVLFFQLASADILLGISPKDKAKKLLALYPEEIVALDISIANQTGLPQKVSMRIVSGEETAFIENGSFQKEIAREAILDAGESQKIEVQLTVLQPSNVEQKITVFFGEGFSQSSSITAKIVSPKLLIVVSSASITRSFGNFKAKMINDSNETIRNIALSIVPEKSIDALEQNIFQLSSLKPGEQIEKQFEFGLNYNLEEEKNIFLLGSFEDANGLHVIQKTIPVQSFAGTQIIGLAIFAVIIILVIWLATRLMKKPKEEKKEEKPAGKKEEIAPEKQKK